MALAPGNRLGAYEIVGLIGAGGMGEVYRARDSRLERQVAIKILPEALRANPERAARFEREAKLLASLNHQHIAGIYGLEQADAEQFIVMELVDGPTLADRIAEGPIPVTEALQIAKQIADALQAAHEANVIHRDLKPANVKVRPDGTVKVLDFGLAKALAGDPLTSPAALTNSPTITSPVGVTGIGVLLGTAAYMSPEQAKGKAADKRSDVWAFGCVLFEMLTGKRPFDSEDVSDTLAAVLRGDPDWAALPPETPSAIQRLLHRCLEKDRHRRVGDIAAALLLIEEAPNLTAPTSGVEPTAAQQVVAAVSATRRGMAVGSAFALVLASAIVGTTVSLVTRPAPPRVARLTIAPSRIAALSIEGIGRDVTITPDGTRVIYLGNAGTQMFARALDQLEPVPIATTSGRLRGPFTSPEGQRVGFVENFTTLKTVPITGGSTLTLGGMDGPVLGATWLPDETVVFATSNQTTGLQRVPSDGGAVTVLTRPDLSRGEADHLWPERLPDGRSVLFTITPTQGGLEGARVAVVDLVSGAQTMLVRGGHHAHYVTSGHLVYAAGGTLRAVAFDVDRLAVHGTPMPVVPRLVTTGSGGGDYAVAADGSLVYVDAPDGASTGSTLVWVDRRGREEPVGAPPRTYQHPRVSPDGTRIVVVVRDREEDIWNWNLPRGPLTRLTFEPGVNVLPVWTPNGHRLVFHSTGGHGVGNLVWQAADGSSSGAADPLTESSNIQAPTGITPDGTQVVLHELTATRGADLRLLTLDAERPSILPQPHGRPEQGHGTTSSVRRESIKPHGVTPLLETPFDERNGIISPDGRWLAYQSDSSGEFEIYVRPFPNVELGQRQVSAAGGTRPVWARSGRELFYVAPDDSLMVVAVEPRGAVWGVPAKLLDGHYVMATPANTGRNYDVAPDGRFLMLKAAGGDLTAAPPQIVVIQHFDEELKRLVPTK